MNVGTVTGNTIGASTGNDNIKFNRAYYQSQFVGINISGTGTETENALNQTGQKLSDISGYITGKDIGLIKKLPDNDHLILYFGTYNPSYNEINGDWKSVNASGTFEIKLP